MHLKFLKFIQAFIMVKMYINLPLKKKDFNSLFVSKIQWTVLVINLIYQMYSNILTL